ALAAYPGGLTRKDLETLWADLADAKPARAHAALWALAAAGRPAVAFLGQRLKPAPPTPDLTKLITALDSKPFAERDAASRALRALGGAAEAALRQARRAPRSAESQRRIDALLDDLERLPPPPAEQGRLRAVRVLELIGTAEARRVLEAVAEGAP